MAGRVSYALRQVVIVLANICIACTSATPAPQPGAKPGGVSASGASLAPPAPASRPAVALRREPDGGDEPGAGVDPDASVRADAAIENAPPAWLADPFSELPPAPPHRGTVEVIFEVASVYRASQRAHTSPLRLRIPATGLSREIYDDYVVRPACTARADSVKAALFVNCFSPDGQITLRAYQVDSELVIEVRGAGDVPPSLPAFTRFKLPKDSGLRFRTQLSPNVARNPSSGP